jgi:hypothetical protein
VPNVFKSSYFVEISGIQEGVVPKANFSKTSAHPRISKVTHSMPGPSFLEGLEIFLPQRR